MTSHGIVDPVDFFTPILLATCNLQHRGCKSQADINSLKSKLSKECSMTGQQTSDSCGEKSALAVLTKLSRKYKDESKTTLDRSIDLPFAQTLPNRHLVVPR
jgi:hypothetical protein